MALAVRRNAILTSHTKGTKQTMCMSGPEVNEKSLAVLYRRGHEALVAESL
jgi:hypothetical protein